MGIKLTNNANATLASGINSSATSITLTSGQGARFPTLTASDYFYATLVDTSNNLEIVKCTARSTDVLTVVRAQETTTARAYSTGDRIEIRLTAQTFIDSTTITSLEPHKVSDQANSSTGYFELPKGTTAERPGSPVNGMLRYNTTTSQSEIYQNGGWVTFAVAAPSSVNYLAVAGGGGGGGPSGNGGVGGGGAGGLLTGSVSVNPSSVYTITVGAGGATQVNGVNTTALGLTAIGGGRGGTASGVAGASGGSGGGGGESSGAAGAGTSGQGFAGGNGNASGDSGAGGGGASAVGSNSANNLAGNGGNGVANSLSGSSVTYAGGGGGSSYVGNPGTGGNGGSGGGGNGATPARSNVSTGGTANTGGGGGGYGTGQSGNGAGGSGIVIISFANTFRAATATGTFTLSNTGGNYIYTFTGSGTITF